MIKINVEYDYNYEIHLSSLSPIEFALYEKDVTSYLKGTLQFYIREHNFEIA